MNSFPWFVEFWEWAKRQATKEKRQDLLLARVGKHWDDWFDDQALNRKSAIEGLRKDLRAQEAFVSYLRNWVKKESGGHDQAATWLLFALAREKPFDEWPGLAQCRKLDGSSGVYGFYLPPPGERLKGEDAKLTHSILVPNLDSGSAKPTYYAGNLQLLDTQAQKTPQQALDAAMNLLTGRAFWWHFLKWALFGSKAIHERYIERRWVRWMLKGFGWAMAGVFVCSLALADIWGYFADDTLLAPVAWGFVGSSLFITFIHLAPIFQEWRRIRLQREEWADCLRRSCVCFVVGDGGDHLKVAGPSFGVTLFVSILLALDKESPAKSQLARRLMDQVKKISPSWGFTGEIQSDGRISSVARLDEKIRVARACGFLSRVITPMQDEGQEKEATSEPLLTHVPGEVFAAGEPSPKVCPCKEMMTLLQVIGAFQLSLSLWLIALALWIGLAIAASATLRDAIRLTSASPDPELRLKLVAISDAAATLRLQIESDDPERFAARITSHYWANPSVEAFSLEAKEPGTGTVWFELIKQDQGLTKGDKEDVAEGDKKYDVKVELLFPRRFWWHELEPVVIELTSLDALINKAEIKKVR
jgi:hypothetical protein